MPQLYLKDFILQAKQALQQAGIDNSELDARLLIGHALNLNHTQILTEANRQLTAGEIAKAQTLIDRRIKREPVARILGEREFWGLPFGLNEATLEPRPDSETLVEAVINFYGGMKDHSAAPRILDLGTGTGCLLLALLHHYPQATGLGIDKAPRATGQAVANARRLEIAERAKFQTGDWFTGITEKFDLIISNPPYIPRADLASLMPEVREHDPMLALDGGGDGLDIYRHLIPQLRAYLKAEGRVIFEAGIGQANAVAALLRAQNFNEIAIHKDFGNIDRCVSARL